MDFNGKNRNEKLELPISFECWIYLRTLAGSILHIFNITCLPWVMFYFCKTCTFSFLKTWCRIWPIFTIFTRSNLQRHIPPVYGAKPQTWNHCQSSETNDFLIPCHSRSCLPIDIHFISPFSYCRIAAGQRQLPDHCWSPGLIRDFSYSPFTLSLGSLLVPERLHSYSPSRITWWSPGVYLWKRIFIFTLKIRHSMYNCTYSQIDHPSLTSDSVCPNKGVADLPLGKESFSPVHTLAWKF